MYSSITVKGPMQNLMMSSGEYQWPRLSGWVIPREALEQKNLSLITFEVKEKKLVMEV
jgi:hypothetical protein